MNSSRLIICSADKVSSYRQHHITHIVSIANPGCSIVRPEWFTGEHLVLYFGDVVSESDAAQCRTQAPTLEVVSEAVGLIYRAWRMETGNVLIHCDYGASRSPAIAYVAMAKELGPGMEEKALQHILEIQPDAVPNKLVVHLGDVLLERHGLLIMPLKKMYDSLNDEIFQAINSLDR